MNFERRFLSDEERFLSQADLPSPYYYPLNEIIRGDCIAILKDFPPESVHAVLTDPPYGLSQKEIVGDDSLKTYEESLPLIEDVLTNNSWFITFAPIGTLRHFIEITESFFEYVWTGFIYYRNMQRILHCGMGRTKISLYLVFKKGNPKRGAFIQDVQEYVYNRHSGKPHHPAEKPLQPIINLIKFASKEGDIILDPFCGSGTTCVGAKMTNRKFIGIEIDKKHHGVALKRLSETPPSLTSFQSSTPKANEK